MLRTLLQNGLNNIKLISISKLNTSNVLFQQSYSGTNSETSSKQKDKTSSSTTQQDKNVNRAESDNEQEKSQHEGPADREAQQKSSNSYEK